MKRVQFINESKKNKLRMRTSGSVEGDIPCVYTDSRERSIVEIVFQDMDYNSITPSIKRIDVYRYSWPSQEGLELRDVDLPYERTMAIRLGSKGNAYKHPADGCGTGTNTKLTKLIKQKACKDMFCTLLVSITLVLKVYNHVYFGGVYKLTP